MARIRTIKPEMAHSIPLSRIPREALYTWTQLWPQCDDAGRYYGDPRLVWAAIYPVRDDVPVIELAAELQLLADHRRLCCYRGCDGKIWLHTLGWHHQKIDRPSQSHIPPCRDHEPTAECAIHGDASCDSTPARFTDAEPVTSEDPQRVGRQSRESREELASDETSGAEVVRVDDGLPAVREGLATVSRALDAVSSTEDLVPRTKNTTASRSATPTAPTRRGTRIPDDFAVDLAMREWAHGEGWTDSEIDAITEEFVDYWQALPGSRALKLDWVKTWKNRLRDQKRHRRGAVRSLRPTADDRVAQGLSLAQRLASEGR